MENVKRAASKMPSGSKGVWGAHAILDPLKGVGQLMILNGCGCAVVDWSGDLSVLCGFVLKSITRAWLGSCKI